MYFRQNKQKINKNTRLYLVLETENGFYNYGKYLNMFYK